MRMSVEQDDPGYQNWIHNRTCKVFLNGVEQKECIMADSDVGMIKRYITDKDGKFFSIGNELPTELLCGKVEIR